MTEPTEQEIEMVRKILEVEQLIDDVRNLINERTKDWTPAQRAHFIAVHHTLATKAVLSA